MAEKTFKFAYEAWLTAISVRGMTKDQRSDYLDLLCMLAREGDKGLPNDDEMLCKLLQCPQSTLDVIKPRLYVVNGRLFNHRLNKSMLKKLSRKRVHKPVDPTKNPYDEAGHVCLSLTEYKKLVGKYGEDLTKKSIEFLSDYKTEKPNYPIVSAYSVINRWVVGAVVEKERKLGLLNTNGNGHVNGNGSVSVINGNSKTGNLMQAHAETKDFINNLYPDANETTNS